MRVASILGVAAGSGPALGTRVEADPFVARRSELETLREWCREARAGRGAWLGLVAGESGVGKSRLVTELERASEQEGALVLRGTAHGTGFLAYEPWADALRGFLRGATSDLKAAALGHDASAVARVPWLADAVPDASVALGIGTPTEEAVADVVAGLLTRLAARGSLLVVLDNVQWADPASVEVARRLLASEAGRDGQGYIVAAVERRPTLASNPWKEALDNSAIAPDGVLALDDLRDSECAALLRQLEPGLAGAELEAAVYNASGGNPLLVRQLATHVSEELARRRRDGSNGGQLASSVPGTAAALWVARLEPLSRDACRGLAVAAVVGPEFDRRVLEGLDVGQGIEVDSLIDEAVAAGIVEPAGLRGRYRFRHGLLRDHLYEGLPQVRRQRLHRAVAHAIETAGALADEEPTLAFHYLEAGRSFRYEALAHTIAAARWNLTQGASDTARDLAERARQLIRELDAEPDVDRARWARRSLELGDVLMLLGHADGESVLLAAASYFESVDDVDALVDCARFVLRQGDLVPLGAEMDDVLPFVERVLPRLDEVDPRRAARVLARFTMVLDGRGQAERQRDLSDRALTLAHASGDPDTVALALSCHRPGTAPDRVDDWLNSARELEALGRRHCNLEHLFHGLFWAVPWELDRGDAAAAARALAEADEIAALVPAGQLATIRNGDLKRAMELLLINRHITMALHVGDYQEAEQFIAELGRRAAEPGQAVRFTSTISTQLGAIADDRSGLGDLAATIETMVADRSEFTGLRTFAALAWSERDPPDIAGVERHFRPLIARGLADLQPDAFLVNLLVVLARVAYNVGDEEGARIVGARLAPYAGRNSVGIISICTGPVDWALGLCAATTGHYEQAVACYASARDLCRRMGTAPFEARVELAWAQALAQGGEDRAEMEKHAGRAQALASELGMARVERQAAELLA